VSVFIKGGMVAPPGGLRVRLDASVVTDTAHRTAVVDANPAPVIPQGMSSHEVLVQLTNDGECSAINKLMVVLMPDAGGATRAKYRIAPGGGFDSVPFRDNNCP